MVSEKILSKEEITAALNERHTAEKQKLLSQGKVTIAGLGGLGSNVAYSLARIGVGHLHLIDFDVVDITNLNRQQYFMEHIGMPKTDALKSLLLKINPYLDIRTDCVKVTEDNLKELFKDATIICERDSHKGIIIGKKGSMLKKIGSTARYEIEKMLDQQVNLKLWVKVKKDWRDSEFLMKNFGYREDE